MVSDITACKIAAILSITVLEAVNLAVFHQDGVILVGVIAIVAGLAGYKVSDQLTSKK